MNRKIMLFLLAVMIIPMAVLQASPIEVKSGLSAVSPAVRPDVDLSLRLIGGKGSVLRPGRDIRITFETSRDAYVIVYNIDAEGLVQLLYPIDGKPRLAHGGKTYYLPADENGIYWQVEGNTGIEYIHAVAVTDGDRLDTDEIMFLAENADLPAEEQLRIDSDPYLAFNMIDEAIVRGAEEKPPATDFTYFYINEKVDYPRYLCNQCHGRDKIDDPYAVECPEIVLEKIVGDGDVDYPFPALFAIRHVDAGDDDGYYSSAYYADNLDGAWDDYNDYDDDRLYLSVYYTNYDYPYYYDWPYYRSWYVSYYSPSYWAWDPWFWDVTFAWTWGGYYYHHRPFQSWYGYNYAYYDWGRHYGYWNDWRWYGGCHHDWRCYDRRDHHRDYRSMYASRRFTKRSINQVMAAASFREIKSTERRKLVKGWTSEIRKRTIEQSRFARRDDGRTDRSSLRDRSSLVNPVRSEARREVIFGNDLRSRSGSGNTRRTIRPDSPAVPTSDKGSRSMLKDRSGSTSRERESLREKILNRNRENTGKSRDAARKREEGARSDKTRRKTREWVKDPVKSRDSSIKRNTERKDSSSSRESPFKRKESSSGNSSVKRSNSSKSSPFNRSSSGSSGSRRSSSSGSSSKGTSRAKRK